MQERVSGNVTASSLSSEELKAELDRLLLQKCTNEQIVDWIQVAFTAQHLHTRGEAVEQQQISFLSFFRWTWMKDKRSPASLSEHWWRQSVNQLLFSVSVTDVSRNLNLCTFSENHPQLHQSVAVLGPNIRCKYCIWIKWIVFVASGGFYKINYRRFRSRSGVLRKYLRDRHTQLEALNALQDLMIHMEHPPSKCYWSTYRGRQI